MADDFLSKPQEQCGVSTDVNNQHQTVLASVVEGVDEQKVATDVTPPMVIPAAWQRVIQSFRWEEQYPPNGGQRHSGLHTGHIFLPFS